jgi:anti-sigma B factor antagonist
MTVHDDVPTVTARGELDIFTSRPLAAQLAELAGQAGAAVLDLSAVTLLDSVGLGVVLKAAGRFQRQGQTLVVVAPAGPARRVLDFAGVPGRITVVESLDDVPAVLA